MLRPALHGGRRSGHDPHRRREPNRSAGTLPVLHRSRRRSPPPEGLRCPPWSPRPSRRTPASEPVSDEAGEIACLVPIESCQLPQCPARNPDIDRSKSMSLRAGQRRGWLGTTVDVTQARRDSSSLISREVVACPIVSESCKSLSAFEGRWRARREKRRTFPTPVSSLKPCGDGLNISKVHELQTRQWFSRS